MAASSALDRLFTQANTAQTESAIVPDFQREIRSVFTYRNTAVSAMSASAGAVDTRMPAKKSAANTETQYQRQQPCGKLAGRLLQIGSHREIRQQQTGEHNTELQDRAQQDPSCFTPLLQ